MTEVMRIGIDANDMNYLQRVSFELTARQNIVATIIENHAMDDNDSILNSKVFATYSKQLSELQAEFELAKLEFARKWLPEEYKEKKNAMWECDFSTGELVIKE